jgi:hypothetical protein
MTRVRSNAAASAASRAKAAPRTPPPAKAAPPRAEVAEPRAKDARLQLWVACAVAATATCLFRTRAPGRDLDALAASLGSAADDAHVATEDLRWEPSRGVLGDLLFGRRLLFLARGKQDETRDLWRARVRVTPDGSVIDVADVRDLTNTPLGDDHALVVRGSRAAFATRAYGQEQSVTLLDLAGEGAQNKTTGWLSETMAVITNWQRTGAASGVGRVDVTFDSPGRAVSLELGETSLALTLFGGDPRKAATAVTASVDLARGELEAGVPGMHADPSMHLPKRFSHWAVDTLRAVSWIGPAPIAWAEDQALALRDTYRRGTFASHDSATDEVAAAPPAPLLLDTSQASVEEAHWPPAAIATIWKSPEPGEGQWVVPDVPWIPKTADVPSAFYETFVRPDEERPYSKVILVAMDMRQLELDMEAGVEDPEPLTGPPGAGRIPRDPHVYRRVVAAFNGAFKTEHGHYGMMVHKRVLLPPVPGAATIVTLEDGGVGFGTWGSGHKVGGIAGVNDDAIASFRQNLDPLIDHGEINPVGRNMWGFTLPGKGAQTERTGLCVTTSGHIVYAWGDDLSGTTLARALKMASCDYALHLDMNPYHTGFLFTSLEDLSARKYKSQLLTSGMSIPVDRYIQYAPKDFFYVMTHDPTPPPLEGASAEPWQPDGGSQPPPHWIVGVWRTHVALGTGSVERSVELLDIEADRATFSIRAGTRDAAAASPLRDLDPERAKHALFAAGMGVASDKHPLGLATDGRLVQAMRGGSSLGAMVVDGDGRLSLALADAVPALGPHDDLAELPVVLWDGHIQAPTSPPDAAAGGTRTALGTTPSGRVLLARGASATATSLATALAAAGCTRALLLDRGLRADGFIDRAGTDRPLRSGYDQSVLYAMSAPLRPRAFRFDAVGTTSPAGAPPLAQGAKSK